MSKHVHPRATSKHKTRSLERLLPGPIALKSCARSVSQTPEAELVLLFHPIPTAFATKLQFFSDRNFVIKHYDVMGSFELSEANGGEVKIGRVWHFPPLELPPSV